MASPAVDIRGLTKTYRFGLRRMAVTAVRDLDISIERGKVVGFVGANGAGKTTTIHAILGLVHADRGSITVLGRSPEDTAMRRRVGFQSEVFHAYRSHTPRRALRYYGRLCGLAGADLERRISAMLSRVGLAGAADRRIATFSKGMCQRMGLAQALLHEPELLVLDEPSSGLDPEGRHLVVELLGEQRDRGVTVFFSSHILSDVEHLCDQVVIIREGRKVADVALADLGDDDQWEIEVSGWTDEVASRLPSGDVVVRVTGPDAVLRVSMAGRDALLGTLSDLPLRLGEVRRQRRSLEEIYLEHVEKSS